MGMNACYMEAAAELLDELKTKSQEEIFERIEELQDEDELLIYDMDKLWDGLHFILTGVSAAAPVNGNPLSEAVVGTDLFSGDEPADFITYIYPERAAGINAALEAFDIEKALLEFKPAELAQNDIYPAIWLEYDREELSGDLLDAFNGIKDFFHAVTEKHRGVIVSIY